MGVYFRKSMSVGPLRFNLSKSGIGMSAGVKGLRVGTGPRGGYVHAGRAGIYYRQTLGSTGRTPAAATSKGRPAPLPIIELQGDDLEGADVSELVAAMPSDIVTRIQQAAALPKPKVLANPFTYKRRKLEWDADRAVPLFYDLDDDLLGVYDDLVDAATALGRSPGRYYDRQEMDLDARERNKGHGGASGLVDRSHLEVRTATPAAVTLNFEPPELATEQRSLFLLPDQVLVQQGASYAAIPYRSIKIHRRPGRFLTPNVPYGVTPVDYTWKYVNKSGQPDRRYKDNPQIPIISIVELDFHGPAGFEFHTAFTDSDAADRFTAAFAAHQAALPPWPAPTAPA